MEFQKVLSHTHHGVPESPESPESPENMSLPPSLSRTFRDRDYRGIRIGIFNDNIDVETTTNHDEL